MVAAGLGLKWIFVHGVVTHQVWGWWMLVLGFWSWGGHSSVLRGGECLFWGFSGFLVMRHHSPALGCWMLVLVMGWSLMSSEGQFWG